MEKGAILGVVEVNRYFLLPIIFVACIFALYVVVAGNAQTSAQEVYTLKVVNQQLSKEHAIAIARTLGIGGSPAERGNVWEFKDAIIYKYGAVKYLNRTLAFDTKNLPEEMPSKDRAMAIAKRYIQRLIEAGILDKNLLSGKLEVVEDEEVVAYRNGTKQRYVLNVHVNVPLEYNGIPLHGAGAKVRIYLSKDGKLAGILSFLGKLVPDKKVSIISKEEAIEKLRRMGYENAKIDSIELVYEVPPPHAMPTTILPAYVIKGRLTLSDGSVVKFAKVIPAVRS